MFKKFFFVFLLFPLLFGGSISGQEFLRTVLPVDFTISSNQFSDKNPDKKNPNEQMLRSLALNNGMNLYQVKINFQASTFISVHRDSSLNRQIMVVKILNKKLSGDTRFRDFSIDSLLMPSTISGTISLKQGEDTLDSFPVELATDNAATTIVLPNNLSLIAGSLQAAIEIESVSNHSWIWAFNELTSLINYYYAYNEILKELINEFDAVSLNQKQGGMDVFMAWHEISRINNYIRQHDFIEKLNLENNDPQGFLERYSTSKRMEKRSATLFRQTLKTDKRGNLSDKRNYCAAYPQLSQKYLDRAHQLQPYLASGFEEVAQVISSPEEKNKLIEVAAFYDVFNRLGKASTPQLIYEHFLELAKQAFDKNQFVASLLLLKNASQIEGWFDEIVLSDTYIMLYNQSLDGVMTSYLRVSIIAYRAGKLEMADKYYDKALVVFDKYGSAYLGNSTGNPSFLHFTEQHLELSQDFLANAEYLKAYKLLKQARKINNCKSIKQDCQPIDSLISMALLGLFNQKMDSVDGLIAQKQSDSALVSLNALERFTMYYEGYFETYPTKEFSQRATVLFRTFYDRGEFLLNGKQPASALTFFLKAQEVERKYLHTQDTRLKVLVYNATVPVIISQIEKADFETWANRMDKADSIYRQAKQLQYEYQQENNEELNAAFFALETKMEQRKCVDLNFRLNSLNELIVNRVQSAKFDLAAGFFQEANSIINNHPNCNIDDVETKNLENKYAALFQYQNKLKKAKQYEKDLKYDSAVQQYVLLSNFYVKHNLEQFAVEEPSLFSFVASTGNPEFTQEVVRYFIQSEEFMQALHFLDLLKEQNIPARETRELQQLVGKGIAAFEGNEEIEKQVHDYTEGNNWYVYFKLARRTVKIKQN